jgi:hypothetical protein
MQVVLVQLQLIFTVALMFLATPEVCALLLTGGAVDRRRGLEMRVLGVKTFGVLTVEVFGSDSRQDISRL